MVARPSNRTSLRPSLRPNKISLTAGTHPVLFIPDIWGDLVNWPAPETAPYRLIGAAMLAFGASSVLAYREVDWDKVIIIVRTEIVWTALATLILFWALVTDGAPAIGWLYVVLMAVWTVLFSIFYNAAP